MVTLAPKLKTLQAKPELFSVVSLFAGGGGSSTGYRMAGGKSYIASEFIDAAADTYQANWPDTKVDRRDIRDVEASEFDIGKELDLLDGSPPCSGFSASGKVEKGWGKKKKYSDSAQESVEDLFFEYIRVLGQLRPRAFVAENVQGLVRGSSKGYFKQIKAEMEGCGYIVQAALCNAKDFGVPQSRPRVIFVGVRGDLHYEGLSYYPKKKRPVISLKQALDGVTLSAEDIRATSIEKYSIYPRLLRLKGGEQDKIRFNLVKAHPDYPCPTISATSSNAGAASVKHWDNRSFAVPELKRIFSLPDDYILKGDYIRRVERMGRMVPALMSKGISRNLYEQGIFGNAP